MSNPPFSTSPLPASWQYAVASNGRSVATYNGDTAVLGSSGILITGFPTLAAFEAASIPNGTPFVQVAGYYTAGDGGAINYVPGTSSIWQVSSADGQTWIPAPDQVFSPEAFGAVGSGSPSNAAVDTAGLQVAFNWGGVVRLSGTYITNATLTVTTAQQQGLIVEGFGRVPASFTGSSQYDAIIRPLAGVTPAIKIDGSGFSNFMQAIVFRDMTLDMTNLTDVATSVGFQYLATYGCSMQNVNAINDGANKVWLKFGPVLSSTSGTYTFCSMNTKGNSIVSTGYSTSNGNTTLTFINHDGGSFNANYTNTIKFLGGTMQGTSNTKFTLANGVGFDANTDVEGGGVCYNVANSFQGINSRCTLTGFTGTYITGTLASAGQVFQDLLSTVNTNPFNINQGEIHLTNQGSPLDSGYSSFHSGSATTSYYCSVGGTTENLLFGFCGVANTFFNGTAAVDSAVYNNTAGGSLWLGAAGSPQMQISSAGGIYLGGSGAGKGGLVLAQLSTGYAATTPQMWSGSGAPSNTYGANNDFYFRADGGAGSCIYQKRAGAWAATAA